MLFAASDFLSDPFLVPDPLSHLWRLPCLLLSGPARGTRLRHSHGMAGQCKKAVCRGWTAGRGSKKGFRNFAWAGRHGVRKAGAQLQLIIVRDVKENKRNFCATSAVKG